MSYPRGIAAGNDLIKAALEWDDADAHRDGGVVFLDAHLKLRRAVKAYKEAIAIPQGKSVSLP